MKIATANAIVLKLIFNIIFKVSCHKIICSQNVRDFRT